MNKVFLGLILAVCLLGMALVMLNDRLGRKQDNRLPQANAEETVQVPGRTSVEIEAAARALEIAEAGLADRSLQEKTPQESAAQAAPPQMPEASLPVRTPVAVSPPAPAPSPVQSTPVKPEPPKPAPAKPEPQKTVAPEPPRVEASEPETPKPEIAKPVQPKPEQAVQAAKDVNRFVIYARDKGATVRLGSKGKMEYSSMTLENPDRVVVDLPGDWKFPANPGVPRNELVSAVRVGKNGDKTRVVIDLKIKPRKVVLVPFKGGDGVDVRVDR